MAKNEAIENIQGNDEEVAARWREQATADDITNREAIGGANLSVINEDDEDNEDDGVIGDEGAIGDDDMIGDGADVINPNSQAMVLYQQQQLNAPAPAPNQNNLPPGQVMVRNQAAISRRRVPGQLQLTAPAPIQNNLPPGQVMVRDQEEEEDMTQAEQDDLARALTLSMAPAAPAPGNARDALYLIASSPENQNVLNKIFDKKEVIFKHDDVTYVNEVKIIYDFVADPGGAGAVKIFVPKNHDLMKLVCLVRFIWPEEGSPEEGSDIAKYMLMGYRLDSKDEDYSIKKKNTEKASQLEEQNRGVEVGGKVQKGGAKFPKILSKFKATPSFLTEDSQKRKLEDFIGSLNSGFIDKAGVNITGKPIPILHNFFDNGHVGKGIEKQFEEFLSLDAYGYQPPVIAYKLYDIKEDIRTDADRSGILKKPTKKLYFYKFSVKYKCAIVNDAIYYQKVVAIQNLYEEKATSGETHHNNLYLKIKGGERWEEQNRGGVEVGGKVQKGGANGGSVASGANGGSVASGGYNRKLKRKELNTMSLNELKKLHRNNSIKMNGNNTVNALINNYIKHK